MSDVGLKELLNSWGFGHILPVLLAESITLRRLRFLTEMDLTYLFRNSKLGDKIEFRFHLLEWKRKNYNKQDSCTDRLEKDLDENDSELTQPSTSSSNLSSFSKTPNPNDFDLYLALQDHPAGEYVKRTLNEKNSMNDTSRKILIEAIVTYMFKNKVRPGKADFDRVSNDIEREFKDDKKIYYNCVGQRPSGRLYDKYYNTLKKLKKCGEIFDTSGSSEKAADSTENKVLNEKAAQAREWLKSNIDPWSEVEEKWRLCYKLRRDDIVNTDGRKLSISWLLSQWSLFYHILGHLLVEIDFMMLYPECPPLMSKWESFREKITPIMNKKLTHSINVCYLEEVNAKTEGSDQILVFLLHVLLHSLRKSNAKSTVKDSQVSFMIQAGSCGQAEQQIEMLKTGHYNRGETLKPIIVAIGGNLDCTKFYVHFDEIKYSAPDFLTAFDISFKIFQVLNLKYPAESWEFWMFVQKYLYGIHLDRDKVSPSILCLISDLK